jgi:hypothetical protein
MRKFFIAGLAALTLALGAPLTASASAIPLAHGATATIGGQSDGASKFATGAGAQTDFSNCRCRRYTRYRVYRYRYYVRYYVYWY